MRWRLIRAVPATLMLGAGLAGVILAPEAAGAGSAQVGAFHPVVVERTEATLEGPDGRGVEGPRMFHAELPRPSIRGDLLVAGIVDGVASSGMEQPPWTLPGGWRRGADVIGGQTATGGSGPPDTGGLQASIWYWPDNPGGVRSVRLGVVPEGTDAASTAFVAEVSGVPTTLRVVGRGSSTSGPRPATYEDRSSVSLDHVLRALPALVLAVFVNGGTSSDGEQFAWSPGWETIGEDPNRNGVDQPILFDSRVWRTSTRPSESMRYSETIDNCAVMVALR